MLAIELCTESQMVKTIPHVHRARIRFRLYFLLIEQWIVSQLK